jgi:hypothetical protein
MSKNHSVAQVFDALIKQTQQRGGCPSVREISDAALAVANVGARTRSTYRPEWHGYIGKIQ